MEAVDLLKELYDLTWDLADHFRDKRFDPTSSDGLRPKAGVPKELLSRVVRANSLLSQALIVLHEPDENQAVEEEILVEEVDLNPDSSSIT
jgi:hypothetical protein